MSIHKLQDITHLSSSDFAVLADKIKKENIPLVYSYTVNHITICKSIVILWTNCFVSHISQLYI